MLEMGSKGGEMNVGKGIEVGGGGGGVKFLSVGKWKFFVGVGGANEWFPRKPTVAN